MERYGSLSAELGAALTPASLMADAKVLAAAKGAIEALAAQRATSEESIAAMETAINNVIAGHYALSGPSPKKVNSHSLSLFLDTITHAGSANRFRNAAIAAAAT